MQHEALVTGRVSEHGKTSEHANTNTRELVSSEDSNSLGLAKTIYKRCMYGIFGREFTKHIVIYGEGLRFWPTLLQPLYL